MNMVFFQAYGNVGGAIIASDGFSQSAKNTLRCIDSLQNKCALLIGGIGAAYVLDRAIAAQGKESLDLTVMGIGCAIKVFDREFNAYLSGKKYEDQMEKR